MNTLRETAQFLNQIEPISLKDMGVHAFNSGTLPITLRKFIGVLESLPLHLDFQAHITPASANVPFDAVFWHTHANGTIRLFYEWQIFRDGVLIESLPTSGKYSITQQGNYMFRVTYRGADGSGYIEVVQEVFVKALPAKPAKNNSPGGGGNPGGGSGNPGGGATQLQPFTFCVFFSVAGGGSQEFTIMARTAIEAEAILIRDHLNNSLENRHIVPGRCLGG